MSQSKTLKKEKLTFNTISQPVVDGDSITIGKDQEHFVKFISKETTLVAIAQEQGISYETVQQNMARNKRLVKRQVVGFMERKLGGIA